MAFSYAAATFLFLVFFIFVFGGNIIDRAMKAGAVTTLLLLLLAVVF